MIDVKSWDLCDHICKNLIVKLDDDYAPGELYGEDTTELNSKITKIDELFDANDSCEYEYDFGDSWEHEIIIEKRLKGY
ncbi:MAG: hypothetical protein PHE70_06090 [Tepidanaerobacteraceae bacterium]|nr:hypothetical protein [Tepidanaerobacteraceae bacterium]